METKPIYFTELLYNIFTLLSKIFTLLSKNLSIFLDNPSHNECVILVTITLLGIVLLASLDPAIPNLLDTQADFERRKNECTLPVDMYWIRYGPASPFLFDRNDASGVRMRALYPNRKPAVRDGITGYVVPYTRAEINDQNELLVITSMATYTLVHVTRGVNTQGRPIQTQPHYLNKNTQIVLKVSKCP